MMGWQEGLEGEAGTQDALAAHLRGGVPATRFLPRSRSHKGQGDEFPWSGMPRRCPEDVGGGDRALAAGGSGYRVLCRSLSQWGLATSHR